MVVQRRASNLAVAEGVILQNKFSTRSPKQFVRFCRRYPTLQALPLIWLKDCPIEWPHNLNLFPSASARNVQRQLFTRKPKGVSNANIHSRSGRRGWHWTWRNLGASAVPISGNLVGTSAPAPELQKVYYYHRHARRYYRRAYRRGYYGGYPGYYGGYYPGYNRGYYGGYYGGYYPRYNRGGLFGGYYGW